jgi:hypothetical protein
METPLDLKEIERKAFRSTYQDGLWDMYLGLVVVCMSIFVYRPADGYNVKNIFMVVLMITVASGLYQTCRKYITLPRMGEVRFGEVRKRKKRTLAIILGMFILFQVGLVGLTALGWSNPGIGETWFDNPSVHASSLPIVASLGSLMVGISMLVKAYFSDFPRGYYIALMMALAVFLMIYLNQPVYPIIIGGLIIIPGLVLFLRFLKTYPQHRENASHE